MKCNVTPQTRFPYKSKRTRLRSPRIGPSFDQGSKRVIRDLTPITGTVVLPAIVEQLEAWNLRSPEARDSRAFPKTKSSAFSGVHVFGALSQVTIASGCGEVNSCRLSELRCACCAFKT